jgi:hypothetical protein
MWRRAGRVVVCSSYVHKATQCVAQVTAPDLRPIAAQTHLGSARRPKASKLSVPMQNVSMQPSPSTSLRWFARGPAISIQGSNSHVTRIKPVKSHAGEATLHSREVCSQMGHRVQIQHMRVLGHSDMGGVGYVLGLCGRLCVACVRVVRGTHGAGGRDTRTT